MCVSIRELRVTLLVISILLGATIAHSRPAVIHEQEQVVLPDEYFGASGVCLIGDELLVLARRKQFVPEYESEYVSLWTVARFVRQSTGTWQFTGELAATPYDENYDLWNYEHFACEGHVAAVSTPQGDSFILERKPSGWEVTRLATAASYVSVHEDTVAFAGSWQSPNAAAVYRKDAAGAWTDVRHAVGNPGGRPDNPEYIGPSDLALASSELVFQGTDYSPSGVGSDYVTDTQVFDLINGEWQLTATLPEAFSDFTVIQDRVAIPMTSWTEPGDVRSLFTRDAAGAWTVKHTLLSDEVAEAWNVVTSGERAYALVDGTVKIFEGEAPRRYRHTATLIPSDRLTPTEPELALSFFSVDSNWVAATGERVRTIYLFNVPAAFPEAQRSQETFEDNTAEGWSVWGQTDWRIVSSSGSRAYRQNDIRGDARAILETSQSVDQSIQADVRIRSLNSTTAWAGLIARYTDPRNFYYLLVDKDSVEIRRIVNGTFGPIATAPLNLVLGRTYRFRLEAIGSRLRAFVNGEMVAEVIDDTHSEGKAGLAMWRSVAEYDNVVVSTSPETDLLRDSFDWGRMDRFWSNTPSNAWTVQYDGGYAYGFLRQALTTTGPRAVTGAPTEDQIVSASVRPRAFNSNGKGSIGLMMRYVDPLNFYYAILTDTDRVILGRRLNGTYTNIDQGRIVVSPNTLYRVRAEAIGSSLRVYVNDQLLAETQDSTFASGRYGVLTFEAAADYDDFSAVRP